MRDLLEIIIGMQGLLIVMLAYVINTLRIRKNNTEEYVQTLEEGKFMRATVRTVVNLIKAKVNEDNTVVYSSISSLEKSLRDFAEQSSDRDKKQDEKQALIDKAQNERIEKLDKTIRGGIQDLALGQENLGKRVEAAYVSEVNRKNIEHRKGGDI